MKLIDITGNRYGKLSVIERSETRIDRNGRKRSMWKCKCDCGSIVNVIGDNLRRGNTISCGCYARDNISKIKTKHGKTNTKLYGIWQTMKNRCNNHNIKCYNDYGGRGISVCKEWMDSFDAFYYWSINNGYIEMHNGHNCSIDRIDCNGNYEPSNCRWVDSVAQANNRRSNRLFTYDGETHNISEWSKIKGIKYKTLHNRIRSGCNFAKAINTTTN